MVTGSQDAKTYLAGLYNFSVKELEVFQIVFIDDKYAWLFDILEFKNEANPDKLGTHAQIPAL